MSQPRGISSIGVALAKRLAQSERGRRLIESLRTERPEPRFDGWLTSYFDDQLSDLDAASAGAGTEAYQLFRDLDDDLWTLLLSRSYESYPNIRALLPELPDPSLQRRWNGAAGLELLNQSKGFYVRVKEQVALRAGVALAESSVLDFGCG